VRQICAGYIKTEFSWFTEALDHEPQDEHTVQGNTGIHRRKTVDYRLAKQQIFSKQGLLLTFLKTQSTILIQFLEGNVFFTPTKVTWSRC